MTQSDIIDFRKSITWTHRIKSAPSHLRLAVSTVVFNVLHKLFQCLSDSQVVDDFNPAPRIVLIGFGGIGNHLHLIPALKALRAFFPDAFIQVLAMSKPSAELLRETHTANSVIDILNPPSYIKKVSTLSKELRALRPDVVIGAAGIDPVFLSIASFLGCSRHRLGADWRGRGFLLTQSVALDGKTYEAVQNMKIVELLIGKPVDESIDAPTLCLSEEWAEMGESWRISLNIQGKTPIIGIHPGSGNEQEWKRWSVERFVETGKRLEQEASSACIFFLGPDEDKLQERLMDEGVSPERIIRETGSILKTASRMMQCRLFIANDSGLRQLAVSLGIPSIGIFGPTSTEKNFFAGGIHTVVTAEHVLCRPCHYTPWWLACHGDQRCLSDVRVDEVVSMALKFLQKVGGQGE